MKLKEYCKKIGISYITGYRLFKSNKLPVNAYQLSTGTIIVEEFAPDLSSSSSKEGNMFDYNKDITIEIFKKMSSLSKEELAYYILSNFELKRINNVNNKPAPLKPSDHFNTCLATMVNHGATVKEVSVLENQIEEIENFNSEMISKEDLEESSDAVFLTLEESKKLKEKLLVKNDSLSKNKDKKE